MSQAQDMKDKPNAAVKNASQTVVEASASGGVSRIDMTFKDHSVLAIVSARGKQAELVVIEPGSPALLPVPTFDDAGPPQGLGDDGILRDDTGKEIV